MLLPFRTSMIHSTFANIAWIVDVVNPEIFNYLRLLWTQKIGNTKTSCLVHNSSNFKGVVDKTSKGSCGLILLTTYAILPPHTKYITNKLNHESRILAHCEVLEIYATESCRGKDWHCIMFTYVFSLIILTTSILIPSGSSLHQIFSYDPHQPPQNLFPLQ